MINMVKPGAMPELPAGFADKFDRKTCGIDDPAAFAKKADLLALYDKTRAASVKWVKSLTQQDLEQPGPEPMRQMLPTVSHLVGLLPVHVAMHLGQMQVARRKLGKPILF